MLFRSWEAPLSKLPYSSYDASEAKDLLKESGDATPTISIQYIDGYDPGTNALMAQVQSELEAVGFKVTLVPEQAAAWIARTETKYTDFTLGWNEAPYQGDPGLYTQPFDFEYGPGKGQIPPGLQKLLNTALDASSAAAFEADLNTVEKYEDSITFPSLPFLALKDYVAYSKDLSGVSVPLSGSTTFLANVG